MYLTQHLNCRHLILCTLPHSIRFLTPLAHLIVIRLHTSRLCGSFPHPCELTPTHGTTGLASWTKPPLQSAPSVLHLVRVFVAKTDWVPIMLLGSCLGIRSDRPISCCTHSLPLLEIPFPLACVDKRRIPISSVYGQASSLFLSFVFPMLVSVRNHCD